MAETIKARFGIGDIVQHNLFGYRGVIVDADADFRGDEAWYQQNAPGSPPKNQPLPPSCAWLGPSRVRG
ncbi:heat shock protein HspQ [Rickettsiella massiliensis]|uniref:heat shock protein HspQ n=1 Tax=Rickettsiella massiliensis TaxID=676517 RepID=UPI00029AF2E4|nr:heat shock protein HspQ [Rickettsiella massiliensis]